MLKKLKRQINRWRFQRSITRLRKTQFCLVSNNCLGRRLYQILGRDYNTPFVGLFMMPECFTELVVNFKDYMSREIQFVNESKYPTHNQQRNSGRHYPIGRLGNTEIHFLHYKSEQEALEKWNRRKRRIDYDHLYYVMVANGPYNEAMLTNFAGPNPNNKVCFHRQQGNQLPTGIYIPSENPEMGNLYSQYQRFVGYFNFADWILGIDQKKP
jgi:uncharacterized protein (DUF1919 family)